MPLVSICCIAYNQRPYIQECLEGLINQSTSFEFEILVHDDASNDGTAEIIENYQRKYPKIIKPIFQVENLYSKGVGITRDLNFPRANGKYIALCEGDDYWIDDFKLQKQVDFLERNPDYGGVSTNNRWFFQDTNEYRDSRLPEGPIKFEDLCKSNVINSQTVLFHKSFAQNLQWMDGLKIGDWAIHLKVTSEKPYYRLPDITAVYRVHNAGVHSTLDEGQKIYNMIKVLEAFYKNFKLGTEEVLIVRKSLLFLIEKLITLRFGDSSEARRMYLTYGGKLLSKSILKSYLSEIL